MPTDSELAGSGPIGGRRDDRSDADRDHLDRDTPFGTLRRCGPGAHAFTTTIASCWRRPRSRRRSRSSAHGWTSRVRGAQLDSETNRLRAALFSSVTHDLRTPLSSIKASVTRACSPMTSVHDADSATRAAHHGARGDRPDEPAGRQPDGPVQDQGGSAGARARAGGDRRAGADGRRADATAADGRRGAVAVRPDLPDVFVDPVQIDQVLTNLLENAARTRPPVARCRWPPRRSATRSRCGSRITAPASRRPNASACSRRSIAATPRRSARGAASGSRSRRRSWSRTAGRIWIEGAPGGGTVVVFELPVKVDRR